MSAGVLTGPLEETALKSIRCSLRGAAYLAVVAGALVGCSADEPGHEFAVPKVVCEVPVPADALSALLPASGRRIAVPEHAFNVDGEGLCKVSVDDDVVLRVTRERIDVGDSAYFILHRRGSIQDPKSTRDRSVAYADRAAASLIKCRGAGVDKEDISIFVDVLKPGRPDEDAMKSLITGYTGAYQKQQPCRPGS
ncbi:hypothetical protein [Streptomyces sennicomposti]|uniref:hypothetical protein n=1 Tax=Streptomyces sennicomposti TaxID=2873384 RepID=UPI0027E0CF7D|nr:hypothetical protein [Streptomyces sennicomposti]